MSVVKYLRKNDEGKLLGNAKVLLKNSDYGTGDYFDEITPKVKWKEYRQKCSDENGFDVNNVEDNGKHIMEVCLPKGTHIIRYGSEMGRFTAPKGTPYDQLGLPYVKESVEFHEYIVIADSIKVLCKVNRGKVAPIFDSQGGGVQYQHFNTIREARGRKHELSEVL